MDGLDFDVAVLGSINTDFAFSVEEFPRPGETLLSSDMRVSPGGKGANQAIASARMGARVAMVGAVGGDERGAELIGHLTENAVNIDRVAKHPTASTGLATIFVKRGGENLIVVAQGANRLVDISQVETDRPHATYYLAQLETPLPAIQAFFAAARRNDIRCVLNAAPASFDAKVLFKFCDIIIVNEPELSTYSGNPLGDATLETISSAAKRLLSHDDQTIIVTRGSKGAIAVRRGAKLVVAAHSTEVTDTTGAGDCFCGTLVATLARGEPLGSAINCANAAAALAVRRSGAADALPTSAELDAFLSTSNDVTPQIHRSSAYNIDS